MKLLDNKTAFITGGSRGIGAAIVRRFAEQGASVGFSYHSKTAAAHQLLDELEQFGNTYRAYKCDITQVEAVNATMEAFLTEFGRIDILVNNAGIIRDNLLGEISIADWNEVISTNLSAAFFHTQLAIKPMIAARNGVIINISSVVGETGNAGQANYAASKAGLIGFSKSVARENGKRNIRCNVLAPGIIDTEMSRSAQLDTQNYIKNNISLKRIGTVEEVADVALFLASDLSRYVTGQVLQVCGGLGY